MKHTLKMLFLLLFVSTVSFAYAQEDAIAKKATKQKHQIQVIQEKLVPWILIKVLQAKDKPPSVKNTPMSDADKDKLRDGKIIRINKSKSGSFWKRLFGGKKVKKEEDPN